MIPWLRPFLVVPLLVLAGALRASIPERPRVIPVSRSLGPDAGRSGRRPDRGRCLRFAARRRPQAHRANAGICAPRSTSTSSSGPVKPTKAPGGSLAGIARCWRKRSRATR